MHEWALAEAVISSLSEITRKKGLRKIKGAYILLGEMQNIDRKVFRFAVRELTKNKKPFDGFTLNIKNEKTTLKCRSCGNEWTFSFSSKMPEDYLEAIHFIPEVSHVYIKCPKCGSRDFEIVKGRGVWIKSVKGVR